jgi:hypothetical protein
MRPKSLGAVHEGRSQQGISSAADY